MEGGEDNRQVMTMSLKEEKSNHKRDEDTAVNQHNPQEKL